MMAEESIDLTKLPGDVRAKLAELELELSEGNVRFIDIRTYVRTYERTRTRTIRTSTIRISRYVL